jgi:hypothetical protein|tara:strand:- start:8243 stop:8458 length:216 start_codon:yes stop_codon:yes gene_type:complete
MSDDKTAQRVWKATLVFETYADLRSFLHKHGVRIQDFEITDSEGKHLGFDEVVLLMGKPSDDGQQTLYDEA